MLPHLDIRRIGPAIYRYSVRAGQADACHCEDALDSLAQCLNDAAESLGHYFASVSVSLDGQALGSYAVQRLQQNPITLAAEMLGKADPPVHRQAA